MCGWFQPDTHIQIDKRYTTKIIIYTLYYQLTNILFDIFESGNEIIKQDGKKEVFKEWN